MKCLELVTIFFQTVLLILQFFGAFGSVYYLVYVILFFVDNDQSQLLHYTDKDLVILFFIFMASLITNCIGIVGTLRKSVFYLLVYEIFIALVTIIFFTSGLLLCGIWTAIGLVVSLILIAILQCLQSVPKKADKPDNNSEQNTVRSYSYLDNNPPDYNSIDFHKQMAPPEYQSVQLMPVHSTTNYNNLQKY